MPPASASALLPMPLPIPPMAFPNPPTTAEKPSETSEEFRVGAFPVLRWPGDALGWSSQRDEEPILGDAPDPSEGDGAVESRFCVLLPFEDFVGGAGRG